MANIDWGCVTLGALVGIGCRKQLRAASRIAATTAASLAGAAAQAVAQVAEETKKSSSGPEEEAAQQWCQRMDQQIQYQFTGNGQADQQGNGKKDK